MMIIIFKAIMMSMDMTDEDILITDVIHKKLAKHFVGRVSIDEQKLVMTLADDNETKLWPY